jgi:phosphomevalonate kinase
MMEKRKRLASCNTGEEKESVDGVIGNFRRIEHELRMKVLTAELENQEKLGRAYDAMASYWGERRQREFGGQASSAYPMHGYNGGMNYNGNHNYTDLS